VHGFSNWKKAMYKDGGFVSHLKSDCHVYAVTAWRNNANRAVEARSLLNAVDMHFVVMLVLMCDIFGRT